MKLYIIGIGVDSGDISARALEIVRKTKNIVLRTKNTNSSKFLVELGIIFQSLDSIYESSRNFDTLAKNLAKRVDEILKTGDTCYLVDGAVSEDISSSILIKKHNDAVVFEGVSSASNAFFIFSECSIGVTKYFAQHINNHTQLHFPLIIAGIEDNLLASKCKLKLSDIIDDECEIKIVINGKIKAIPLYELDRLKSYDMSTAIFIDKPKLRGEYYYDLTKLCDIVKALRAPDGCAWDRVQTKESIRKNLIEECYELVDAIDSNNDEKMLEEIGDVLLQVVFHTVFAEERGAFDMREVISEICKKLIFRHSHVFGSDKANNAEAALDFWDKNKFKEKGFESATDYVNDVPKAFPALMRAQKVLKRIDKNKSVEISESELHDCIAKLLNKSGKTSKDIGDILLVMSILANKLKFDAEESLYFAIQNLLDSYNKKADLNFDLYDYINGRQN